MKQIKLTQNKFALVDDDDFDFINKWKWYYNAQGYAVRKPYIKGSGRKNQKSLSIRMHRLINKTPEEFETDHINRNKLDNRKENVRNVNPSQNRINQGLRIDNTSGIKGVTWDKQTNKWRAFICIHKKMINLGRHLNIDKALFVRQQAELIYHII